MNNLCFRKFTFQFTIVWHTWSTHMFTIRPEFLTTVSRYYNAKVIHYKEFEDIVVKINPDTQNQGTQKHSPRFWMSQIMYLRDKTACSAFFFIVLNVVFRLMCHEMGQEGIRDPHRRGDDSLVLPNQMLLVCVTHPSPSSDETH